MQIPNWYELALLALAAYRVWRLLAEDDILNWPRNWFYAHLPDNRARFYASELIGCPWCLGAWLSAAWWGVWQAWPHGTLVAAGLAAVSTLVGVLGHFLAVED